MVQINWGLLGNAQNQFQNALMQGAAFGTEIRQQREEKEYKNALAQFDPANPETLKPIMAARPEVGLHLQGQVAQQQRAQQQAEQQQQQQRRADLPLLGNLLNHAQDEATYQQARQAAAQYGIDTSQLPPNFDPQWIGQQRAVVGMLQSPKGQEILSTAGKIAHDEGFKQGTPEFAARVTELAEAGMQQLISYQPGGGVAAVNKRTGQTRPIVQPGPSIAQPQRYNPNEWEEIDGAGGGGGNVTSKFLDGF